MTVTLHLVVRDDRMPALFRAVFLLLFAISLIPSQQSAVDAAEAALNPAVEAQRSRARDLGIVVGR